MPVNRFWSSVGTVLGYLIGVGLLTHIMVQIATLFGFLPRSTQVLVGAVASIIVPVVGTMYYIDWRWGWKWEHIGLGRSPGPAAGKWLLGAAAGAAGAFVAHIASATIAAGAFTFTLPTVSLISNPFQLAVGLLTLFVAELVFRGAATSRLQADLTPRDVLIAAPLIPVAWFLLTFIFGYGYLPFGYQHNYDLAAILFVTLLFLRTDSVWLSAGLRMGFFGAISLTTLSVTDEGGILVWGLGALILVAMEWSRQQRMPKRTTQRGRTTRGPWGPH